MTGTAGRASLRDRVETLWARRPGVEPLFRPTTVLRWRREWPQSLAFHACPLPPARIAGGHRPFQLDRLDDGEWYCGRLPLDGPSDPRVSALLRECLGHQTVRANLHLMLHPPGLGDAQLFLTLSTRGHALEAEVALHCTSPESEPEAIRRVLAALDLTRFVRPGQLKPPRGWRPGETRHLTLSGLPPELGLATRLADRVVQPGWDRGPVLEEAELFFAADEDVYEILRPRLNAMARGWNCEIRGGYPDDFDPFTSPALPPPGEEYRYPVAARAGRGVDGRLPAIQVDVVHTPGGSYLEFLSGGGARKLHPYADLADVELEIWEGPPECRWDDPHAG